MKVTVKYDRGSLEAALSDVYEPIAGAATKALRLAAAEAVANGRNTIAEAGFSKRWQNTLRGDVYPKSGASLKAAAAIYHKIYYADVFESGATIRGKPTLWVPMSGTPKKIGAKRITPARFAQQIGPLFPLARKGRKILAAQMGVSKADAKRGPPYKITMPRLRRGKTAAQTVAVPLFVGIPSVNIKKRFGIYDAINRAAADLPRLYLANLKVD